MRVTSFRITSIGLLAALVVSAPTSAQRRTRRPAAPAVEAGPGEIAARWQTAASHPGDPRFVDLPFMVVFAASQAREDDGIQQFLHLGTDVVASNNPAPMGPDGGLHVVMPGGRVRKLFPLPQHENVPGLIDTPFRQLHKGAVCEPHVSNDGTRVYFTWFHDQTWKRNGGGWQNQELSYKGADLYSIDLAPLIADPTVSAASLPVKRLTSKEYDGFHKNNVRQTLASRAEFALNPSAPGFANQLWGTCNLHMIEMETEHGLKAVFCSDRSRVANSNSAAGKPNHNFNLFVADILPDGSLGPAHQAQYYTTTSALSPEPMRDGFCFSYQSSTDNFRRWDLQTVTSGGRWGPLLGYAQASELYHFGTLITKDVSGELHDWFIGVKYYNLNNGGFGQLHLLDLDDAGINEFVQHPGGHTEAEQVLVNLTPEVTIRDLPSPQAVVGGESVYVGKMSTPRAGRMGGEFLAAYTPTSANRWIADADGNVGEFDSHIVYRPDTDPFSPQLPYDPQTQAGLAVVVDDVSGRYNLAWPTPVLSWMDRHGTPTQSTSSSATDPNSAITRGMPWADIGTSAIWNTDIRPYDCYFGSGNIPYHPNALSANDEIDLDQSIEGLRYVQDQSDFCEYLLPETVLGIQINLTSNRTDWDSTWNPAYETDATRLNWSRGEKEASRILGVYDVRTQNVADQSFIAQIPSDVPFDFHLLDSRYGMKLIDVRSWHALQPRESRMDCGGCHQHERGFGIPFAGTEASARTPLDLVRQTLFYAYDPDCKPTIQVTPDATVEVPEWTEDIWPEFDQHCSACHDATVSTDAAALAALDYADEESAYDTIRDRRYANSVLGALGSPVFWAAYGERTDGRDNDTPEYQPNYAAGDWGYRFSDVHPGLCAASNPAWASWVHRLGTWIDNHMPRNRGNTAYDYKTDRFHPTVDFAYTNDPASPGQIRVGWWDDRGPVSLEIFRDGQLIASPQNQQNGFVLVADGGLGPGATIEVIATDAAGNRQFKAKTLLELQNE